MKETKTNYTIAEMANMSDAEILAMVNEYRDSRKIAKARINLLNALTQYAKVLNLDIDESTANTIISMLETYEGSIKTIQEIDPSLFNLSDLQETIQKYLK